MSVTKLYVECKRGMGNESINRNKKRQQYTHDQCLLNCDRMQLLIISFDSIHLQSICKSELDPKSIIKKKERECTNDY